MRIQYMTDDLYKKKLGGLKYRNKLIEQNINLKKEMNKYKWYNRFLNRIKKNIKTSNIILFAAVIAIFAFTTVCLYIQYNTSTEVSSTLMTLWYSFWTIEITALAGIKMSKVKHDYSSSTTNDEIVNNDNDNYSNDFDNE